jgi:adenine-specific DNA-methyltransferase
MATKISTKHVETLTHDEARRINIPSAEQQSFVQPDQTAPKPVRYPRNTDLDPQLVWRGKDAQDESDLVVNAPPLYIQEKVHPKVLIDDLLRHASLTSPCRSGAGGEGQQTDLFADFNGIQPDADKTEFYQHDQNWTNRMILGDSLQVMASLAEREGLRGKVQCIYFDPPYGIKFNSNFQWSTTSRDVKDGNSQHITREPEQVKAFRDTWRDGIHSYLTYLRDRLTVARDLLNESGSIFVQIGDENVHRVRAVMDEVFGDTNFVKQITVHTSGNSTGDLRRISDYVIWYCKDSENLKFRRLYFEKRSGGDSTFTNLELEDLTTRPMTNREKQGVDMLPQSSKPFRLLPLHSQGTGFAETFDHQGKNFNIPSNAHWRTTHQGLARAGKASRLTGLNRSLNSVYYHADFPVEQYTTTWSDTAAETAKTYVVQTSTKIIERCILMSTDPGDLVLDPTCGSGTTATVAEQWGRRWITIDTSRVALALARARIMGARYPFYLLADSKEGQKKEAEITQTIPSTQPVCCNIRHGFVYERVPHITLKSIANNADIDVIWQKWQATLEPLLTELNTTLNTHWQEWEVPRELPENIKNDSYSRNTGAGLMAKTLLKDWWQARIARQKEIDASIAAKAEFEYLFDKPYQNKNCVRVAGPFTVESLSPHRMMAMDEDDELIDTLHQDPAGYPARQTFPQMILDNLKTSGVQQADKADKINFTAITPWAGDGSICAEGRYQEGDTEKRAGIFIGPEFGTVQRSDLVAAARECGDAGFDVLMACAFNYEAHATDFSKLGRIPVLKARMNADLHMAEDLKNTGKGNLFVIFGEPDIDILSTDGNNLKTTLAGKDTYTVPAGEQLKVKINGVDVFKPQTGEVISHDIDGIACWFIDTDYNEESFFVRHAYFLGANDPYSALKTTLKAEINADAWGTLNSDVSRPFDKPKSGRIAVKVINHLGDEVMKVFKLA